MDDEIEIDLRKIIRKLLQYWYWIVGVAVLAGLTAFVFTFTQPRYYEASAMIALRRPLYQPNFDSRYQTIAPITLNNKIVADFAESDEVVSAVYEAWQSADKSKTTLKAFRENYLSTKAGDDTTVVYLIVRLKDGAEALRLTNLWANQLVSRLNQIYAAQTQDQIRYFESQADIAQQNLLQAQTQLVNFETQNKVNILTNQLNTLLEQQREYLRRLKLIEYVQRDTNTLLKEYETMPADKTLPNSERSKLLFLQLRVYADTTSTSLSPIQFQLSSADASQTSLVVKDFREVIQTWLKALQAQSDEIQKQVDRSNEQILQLQYQISNINSMKETLQRNKDVALDTFTVMIRKA
ncbi:MAG: Wzz/FepE/Etk N-terminal domain-containing protein, partial [Candidatus Kryptoniota bacterium]